MNSKITKYTGIGELVAGIGVIISLIFVGYELRENNQMMQASTDNLIYELQDGVYADLETNANLINIRAKLFNNDELTAAEVDQYQWHHWRLLNIWELAFDRYQDGLLSEEKWSAWNHAIEVEVLSPPVGLTKEWWEEFGRFSYGDAFAAHVEEAYSRYSTN